MVLTARVPTPLHTTPALTMRRHYGIPLVVIVRAGVVWSGVGTLAVALLVGLLLPPAVASPSWDRGASCGCPAGGSALSALIAVRLRCGVGAFAFSLGEEMCQWGEGDPRVP